MCTNPTIFLLVFHCNYGHILYPLRNKARYCSKVVIFNISLLHNNPLEKTIAIIFSLFFFTTEPHPLPIRWCNYILQKCSVYLQLTRVTVRDRRKSYTSLRSLKAYSVVVLTYIHISSLRRHQTAIYKIAKIFATVILFQQIFRREHYA